MKIPYDYVTFSQVEEEKIHFFTATGRGISFKEAVQNLVNQKKHLHGLPIVPDFLSWNLRNEQTFQELIGRIPVSIDSVLSVGESKDGNKTRLSTYNHIQISREACYCDESLLSINYFVTIYVLSGSCRLTMNHTTRTLKKGELYILPPRLGYSAFTTPDDFVITIISDKEHFAENFRFLLYQNHPLSAFFRTSLFGKKEDFLYFQMEATKDVRSILAHLFAEFVTDDELAEALFNHYLQIFYANIIRSTRHTQIQKNQQTKLNAMNLMPLILQYISDHYHTLTLPELAEHFHYESTYLSKQIQKATGKKYSDIITSLKLEEAKELLLHSSESIESIAELCGYRSSDHFAYMFRQAEGISPSGFRQNR